MSRNRCTTENRVGHAGASIRWCVECGDFHLSLGFIQISLTADQFTHLHSLVNEAMYRIGKQEGLQPENPNFRINTKHGFH